MTFDFLLLLLLLTIFTGVVALVDMVYHAIIGQPRKKTGKFPVIIEYCRAFFPVLLAVFLIRSFIAQPYRVPTGSLEPTVMPGDFILVTQYDYGVKFPVWNKTLFKVGEPKRGQIALFYWPVNHAVTFVKRVIGTPGDHISYIDKVLYINGKKMSQKLVGHATDNDGPGTPSWKMAVYSENLDGVTHKIYRCAQAEMNCPVPGVHNFYNLIVPKGEYFMMGDNRDNSDDSRSWGFVPVKNFIGRARWVWLSWNAEATNWLHKIRWHRFGTAL